ncbi:MAG: AMP-binding protein [Nocardioidaceae bacterium]
MSSLRPVRGSAAEIHALLREWETAADPEPLVVATSGSTGEPKPVLLSRRALRASADATHERLGGPGRWLLRLPADYVAGLLVLYRSVRAGLEPLVAGTGRSEPAAGDGRRYVSLVPTQLHRMLADPAELDLLRSFDTVLVGGAALDPVLRERSARHQVAVVATYGMSETCGGCVYDGRPLPGVQVASGPDGRVRVAGPVLFDGYEGRPDLTAQVLRDGWFLTPDLGSVADDGRVVVHGRVDDVVVSGGVNVAAGAVARRLREHPAVRDAEVVGVPDREWGRVVVGVLVGDLALDDARDWVGERHPRSWAPQRLVPVAALPLLANGKVDRRAVESIAAGGR